MEYVSYTITPMTHKMQEGGEGEGHTPSTPHSTIGLPPYPPAPVMFDHIHKTFALVRGGESNVSG